MAGMEELEVHSKSYLVRWVNVRSEHTISWSIQPHKKSLNFGIFKHPGHAVGSVTPSDSNSVHSGEPKDAPSLHNQPRSSSLNVTEKLKGLGLKPISWIGKCEADKISQGTYDVAQNEGGNYALVIDNTFSKQISKTATFVLLTYPSHAPPQSGHLVHHSQTVVSTGGPGAPPGLGQSSPKLKPVENAEVGGQSTRMRGWSISKQPPPRSSGSSNGAAAGLVHTGILQKRRRKRHQGYARRFFSLDFTSSTLSYYHDRNSSALRGAIPLSLAAVATNAQTREISIDSGAEIWHLRAVNKIDFEAWKRVLEKASKAQSEEGRKDERHQKQRAHAPQTTNGAAASATAGKEDWARVETLVGKVSGTRDAVRRLAKDTDPKYLSSPSATVSSPVLTERRETSPSPSSSTVEMNGDESNESREKRPFWKRKPSHPNTHALFRKNLNAQLAVPTPAVESTAIPTRGAKPPSAENHVRHHHEEGIHDHLMALLRDLDSVVAEFSALISESKQRRLPSHSIQPRLSVESDISQEFFDATDGDASPLLTIQDDSEEEMEEPEEESVVDDEDSLSGSEVDDSDTFTRKGFRLDNSSSLFPLKPKSLTPLPLAAVSRRSQIPPPTVLPPSLIGFLRKNVGKDFSTISMPVSANEPTSLLQRAAEMFEYSNLLDKAANATDGLERLIYVTAFAISPLSNARVKERAIRKPFNPMLGETFELVREDCGFRFVAEKVSHRPVQLAFQADARDWSLKQSPVPTQRFWGKSAEIVTEGKARLTLHPNGERFSWSMASSFLRNIIAGEKYVEPVGEMIVLNETTGQKTVVTFKAGGMFSGRSEEVAVKAFDTHGQELPLGLYGNWTSSLSLTEHGNQTKIPIWSAGPLVAQAPKHYGLTTFAVALNEITPIEKGKLPVTDTRLRPDQRALEDGDLDRAEELKVQVEEGQRTRRTQMEQKGEEWKPRWFTKVEGADGGGGGHEDVVWRLKSGKDGYWEERASGNWTRTLPIFGL